MVGFLDLYGLINARIVSLGKYGKIREIMSSLPERVLKGLEKLWFWGDTS